MKRKMAFIMASVMMITAPANVVLAGDWGGQTPS